MIGAINMKMVTTSLSLSVPSTKSWWKSTTLINLPTMGLLQWNLINPEGLKKRWSAALVSALRIVTSKPLSVMSTPYSLGWIQGHLVLKLNALVWLLGLVEDEWLFLGFCLKIQPWLKQWEKKKNRRKKREEKKENWLILNEVSFRV